MYVNPEDLINPLSPDPRIRNGSLSDPSHRCLADGQSRDGGLNVFKRLFVFVLSTDTMK